MEGNPQNQEDWHKIADLDLRRATNALAKNDPASLDRRETVAETLHRLHPLLLVEEEKFQTPARSTRPAAAAPISDDHCPMSPRQSDLRPPTSDLRPPTSDL